MTTITDLTQTITSLESRQRGLLADLGPASLDDAERAAQIERDLDIIDQEMTAARHALAAAQAEAERAALAEQRRRAAIDKEMARRRLRALEADARDARATWLDGTAVILEAEATLDEARRARAAATDEAAQEMRLIQLRDKGVTLETHLPEVCRDVTLIRQEAERQRQRASFIRAGVNMQPIEEERAERAAVVAESARQQQVHHLRSRRAIAQGDLYGATRARDVLVGWNPATAGRDRPTSIEVANAESLVARHTATLAEVERELAAVGGQA